MADAAGAEVGAIILQIRRHLLELSSPLLERSLLLITAVVPPLSRFDVHPHRYVVRLGFLDGKQGFVFHFLQSFWYRLLVDIHIDEQQQRGSA